MPVSLDYSLPIATGGSGAITADNEIEFTFPPQAGRAKNIRYSLLRDSTGESVIPLQLGESIDNVQEGGALTLPDESTLYFQIQFENPNDNNTLGPWSPPMALITPRVVGIELKDIKKVIPSSVTSPTQPAGIDLSDLGLSFASGDLLVIWALGMINSPAGSSHAVGRGAATGWTEHHFLAGGTGSVHGGGRVLTKVSDGTEDAIVPLLWSGGSGGTITHYAAYFVGSFTADGIATAFAAAGQVTALVPATQQAVPSGQSEDPLICYAVSISQGSATGMTFTGDTLDIDQAQNVSTTQAASLKAVLYDIDVGVSTLVANKTDTGNCNLLMSGAISFIEAG